MRTNIDIDDDLLERAMAATGQTTKRATVEAALLLAVREHRQRQAIANLKGIGWEGDLDELREERFGDWSHDRR